MVNLEKSSLSPSQRVEFLSFELNTRFLVPQRKRHSIKKDIARLLVLSMSGPVPACWLAVVIGQVVSLSKAFTPAHFLLQNAYCSLASQTSWSSLIHLSMAAVVDLTDAMARIYHCRGELMVLPPPDTTLETDTSQSGWGVVLMGTSLSTAGWWKHPRLQHINKLELRSIWKSLCRFELSLKTSMLVQTDNAITWPTSTTLVVGFGA